MSRKQERVIELVARALRDLREDLPTDDMTDHGIDQITSAIAYALRHADGHFDVEAFKRAAGVYS